MAKSLINIQVAIEDDGQAVADKLIKVSGARQEALTAILAMLGGLGTSRLARLTVGVEDATNHTKATATATCTQASISGDDTIVIGHVTLTWKASASGEDQVAIGASDTAAATNLAAKINAHSKLGAFVSATSAVGVVTVTATAAGQAGNAVLLSETGTGVVLSGTVLSGATTTTQSVARDHSFGVA